MILVVMAATWKQISYNFLFFLAGLQSIPQSVIEAAAIDGARPMRRFWTIIFPLLSPTTFFLLVVNIVYVFFDTFGIIDAVTGGGPAKATDDAGLQGLCRRPPRRRSRRLGGAIGDPDGHRHRADRHPVPLHRAQGELLMVEHRPLNATFMPHLILIARRRDRRFPVYLAFVASTWDDATIINGQHAAHARGRYARELHPHPVRPARDVSTREPVGNMLLNSLHHGDGSRSARSSSRSSRPSRSSISASRSA
jgi:hypothetical protein